MSFQNCFSFGSSSYQKKVLRILSRGVKKAVLNAGFETSVGDDDGDDDDDNDEPVVLHVRIIVDDMLDA